MIAASWCVLYSKIGFWYDVMLRFHLSTEWKHSSVHRQAAGLHLSSGHPQGCDRGDPDHHGETPCHTHIVLLIPNGRNVDLIWNCQWREMSRIIRTRDSLVLLVHSTYSKQFTSTAECSSCIDMGFELIILSTELLTTERLLEPFLMHRKWKEAMQVDFNTALFADGDREAQDKRPRNNERGSGHVWWWR